MREKRGWGRGGSSVLPRHLGSGLVSLYFWLGLGAVQIAAGAPLPNTTTFRSEGMKNVHLTVTVTGAPDSLGEAGNLRLISTGEDASELSGTYNMKDGKLTATFNAQRDWKLLTYESLAFDTPGPVVQISGPVMVDPIQPKSLTVKPDLQSTTGDILAFRASAMEIPSGGGTSTCQIDLYFIQHETSRTIGWKAQEVKQDGRDLVFQIGRPSGEESSADVVLEACEGDDQWVYRSSPIEIVQFRSLKVIPQDKKGAAQLLVLKAPASRDNPAQTLKASFLGGPDGIPELKKGETVSFALQGDSYHAEISLDCSPETIELPALSLIAHDDGGRVLLRSESKTLLCAPSDALVKVIAQFFRDHPLLGLLIGVLSSAIIIVCTIFLLRLRRGRRSASRTEVKLVSPPLVLPVVSSAPAKDSFSEAWRANIAEIIRSHLAPLSKVMLEVRDILREIQDHQLQQPTTANLRDPSPQPGLIPLQATGTITNLVSHWWADGANRDRLDDLLLRNSSIKPYRSSNVQDSMRSPANRTFLFQPSEGLAEWLGSTQQGELFLVPGDPKLFQTGDSLKFLGALFEGLGESLSNIRFRRVIKACHLRKELGSTERYRLVERGLLEFEGRSVAETVPAPSVAPYRAPQPAPTVQPILPERELAEVVRRAVGEVVSGGLSGQIQDLSQQVRTLVENGSRQGIESPRQDPNVSAALSAFGQRLNTIEGLARLVETLRESLVRIEAGVQDLRLSHPLPPAPVSSAPEPALPGPAVGNLRTDREGQGDDAISEGEYPPLPPPVTAFDLPESPEELWSSLQCWWPTTLISGIPDGYLAADPSAAYVLNLQEAKRLLSKASGDRGWQVDLVHVKLPENTSASERSLQIHEPRSTGNQQVICTCSPSPFTAALLFQFALRVRGDRRREIAVLPAPGLRLTGSIEGYARLAGGKLPEHVTSLLEVTRPAILSQSGTGDLYTVTLPMQGTFQ